ncbi:glycerophosphodiester phosphodiesterase [Pontibacter diazotrophicus]|uniref:Glycerophosphodiester phosphodiesterase n=1 Tax=Pontibacter diazotrophicus TaxID=1400979 RepID=A0A3D8LGQ9_9BACT|nr:glycerophosphodiester phosphodiesterase family protein [Pontibacter diazotrophicus]RDV16639.1 glycerophosphodiester phosphodiesterase [Pontibacter diazotrophicus]
MANSAVSNNLPAFDKQGHRGGRGLMPENTVPAMLKALSEGVTTLEMDAHVSRDNQVLLSHDPHINPEHELLPDGSETPAADAEKHVWYNMNYSDIRRYDAGSKFYSRFPEQQRMKAYKPLLSEVIDAVQAYLINHRLPQVFYNIETKSKPETDGIHHPVPEEFVQLLMKLVEEKEMKEWVIIQSFDVRTLQVLHEKHPEVSISLLVENEKSLEQNLSKLGFTPTIYSPDYDLVTKDLVEETHRRGIKLIPWTVNELDKMRQLKQLGVDGLISDYPNLFNKL